MQKHAVILGAGPAGLSAAWELSKEGARVDVIEMESRVGGLCRSTKKGDYILDLGGHRFITHDDALLAQIEGLMGEELMLRQRKSTIRLQGKFFSYPLEIVDILKKMELRISLKSGLDLLMTKLGAYRTMPDTSFENWVIKRFGRTMYDVYFGPYSYKLWGIPPDEISADWAAQRISLINITDVLLRALGRKKDMPKTYAANFLYPKKGIGQIFERISEEIEKGNGKVHLNSKVEKIILKDNHIEKIIYIHDGTEKEISGDFVISTIPIFEFILGIEPKAEDRYLSVAGAMKVRSIKFLHMMLNVEHISDNTWIYVPEEKYLFFRIQDRRNWSPTTVPGGHNALTLEIACNKNDSIWNAPNDQIFERCIKDLEELGLIARHMVTGYFTEKIEYAYPVYSLDYRESVKTLCDFLSGIKDFISIGRQGLYRYNNMDHSMQMGMLTAKHILHGYPRQRIFKIAMENAPFDNSHSKLYFGKGRTSLSDL